jgi:hypothetical protein
MTNHYKYSWSLYKAQSEKFEDDYNYYLDFTKGHKTLELFSGYGRLTNYLYLNGVDIESVELEPNFAKYIDISDHRNHVCNVLDFKPIIKFERILAAYNSFCLITDVKNIHQFFYNLDSWLIDGGLVSLSYYHPNAWKNVSENESSFIHNEEQITHVSSFDLSNRSQQLGIWIDKYYHKSKVESYSYPVRIYETEKCLSVFLKHTNLTLKNIILNYNVPNISDPGWVEFILQKKVFTQ